jgi:hypothetical protein
MAKSIQELAEKFLETSLEKDLYIDTLGATTKKKALS